MHTDHYRIYISTQVNPNIDIVPHVAVTYQSEERGHLQGSENDLHKNLPKLVNQKGREPDKMTKTE